jgi:hypothetical protein
MERRSKAISGCGELRKRVNPKGSKNSFNGSALLFFIGYITEVNNDRPFFRLLVLLCEQTVNKKDKFLL